MLRRVFPEQKIKTPKVNVQNSSINLKKLPVNLVTDEHKARLHPKISRLYTRKGTKTQQKHKQNSRRHHERR